MKLTRKQVNDISESLECGMVVYINRNTLEIKEILDWEDSIGDIEFWEEELEKIERYWDDYSEITKMGSRESFQIMEDFVEEVEDSRLKADLIKILNRKSPFANFKAEVETSAYRQKWFDFRSSCYINYAKEQLRLEEIEFE